MKTLHYLRAILVLLVTPASTLALSISALILGSCTRSPAVWVQALAKRWGRLICSLAGARVSVEGRENLVQAGPYIFAANHQSQFDIFALQGYLGCDFRWMAKKELFAVPIFGAAMRSAGYISVDRSRGRQAMQSLIEAARRIADGTSVVIFPEGTRSRDDQLQDFKSGAMVLAIKAGVPIVPVAIIGTHQILPKGKLLARSGQVLIKIGQPIDTTKFSGSDKQALALRLQQAVADLIAG
ncbi:MAG: lysophospholipid acyltransferase family protein [Desulfobulbaceae bacterium]|nr:lysophospholipid acyltransferase family protein [Desulfobulbaceae bacterium]